jgi:hypothetical protein
VKLWKELTIEEIADYTDWARTEFGDPRLNSRVNPTWHPVVRLECARLIAMQALRDMEDMGEAFMAGLHEWLMSEGVEVPNTGGPHVADWARYVAELRRASLSHPDDPAETSDADPGL